MDNYENMYKTICRLCLSRSSDEEMFSLIDHSSDDGLSYYGKAITIVTNVQLQKDDKLPTVMCRKCIELLKQTIYFKLKCESADEVLKKLVNKHVSSNTSDIEEIVCEYVIFNQYFPANSNFKLSRRNRKHKKSVVKTITPHESDHNTPDDKFGSDVGPVDADIDLADRMYDFDDFIDKEDFKSNQNEKEDDYKNETLDAMQYIINSGTTFNYIRCKSKVKREPKYRPVPIKERNLICKICHKMLANRLTYDHHMQRHNNCKFICDQCGKGFPVLTEMHMHQIARHGVGPFLQCDHCPYKAPRKLDLIEHLRLHTGERPFTCEKCGLTFRRRAIWRNHLVCHMEKQYQCTYCPRKFYRHGDMLAHSNNVHERVYMYACSICSVTYTKTETVRRHMLVKHAIPRDKQGKILRVMNRNSEIQAKVI